MEVVGKMIEEAYILSDKELIVLLKGMKYTKCFGIMEKEIELEQDEIIKLLQEMTVKKIISSNGEEFIILNPYKEIIHSMAKADYVLVVHNKNHGEDVCYYAGLSENVIKCEKNINGSHTFRFFIIPGCGFFSTELGIENLRSEELNEKLFSEEEDKEKGIYGDFFDSMEKRNNIVSLTEIIQISGNIRNSILIVEDGLTNYMMISDYYGIRREPYSFERYISCINEFTGGMVL